MNKKKVLAEIRVFLLMLIVILSLRSALADWNDVPTGSMKPTIQEGDRVVVNKLAYDLKVPFTTFHLAQWDDPKRGDIVVFFSPVDGIRLVKRVVAVPGDRVRMEENQLFVNGAPAPWVTELREVDDSKALVFVTDEVLDGHRHKVQFMPQIPATRTIAETTVPQGHYFVLGDNRDDSNDSRYIGTIERRRIVGKATAVAFSLDRDHWYAPRFERFFKGLD